MKKRVQHLSKKGQITIPAESRARYDLKPGDLVSVQEKDGAIFLLPLAKNPITQLRGLLKGKLPKGVSLAADLLAERRLEEQLEAKKRFR